MRRAAFAHDRRADWRPADRLQRRQVLRCVDRKKSANSYTRGGWQSGNDAEPRGAKANRPRGPVSKQVLYRQQEKFTGDNCEGLSQRRVGEGDA
jgi:hypothetical protein